jgi:uncharacterized protein YbjT (DUF2867 family)
MKKALLVGATGLVGGHCLRRLLADGSYGRVTVLARRPVGLTHERLVEKIVDFDRLAEQAGALLVDVDDLFVCLGTTIKAAGSQAAFRRVDHDLVVEVGRLARAAGARRCGLVSSIGADATASAFYLRTKGEAERDLAAVGFESMEILRPSFLMGERREKRSAEAVGIAVTARAAGLMMGPLRKYRPISADTVAAALLAAVRRGTPGVHVRTFDEITALAAS